MIAFRFNRFIQIRIGSFLLTSLSNYQIERTSDSLNEGLPMKMSREKFQRNDIFFYEQYSKFNTRLIHKSRFLIGQVPIKNMG